MFQMKNTLNEISNRLDTAGGNIGKPEGIALATNQNETKRKKNDGWEMKTVPVSCEKISEDL